MKLKYVTDIHYGLFGIQNGACSINKTLTDTFRIIPLHCGLSGKDICNDFLIIFHIFTSLKLIRISDVYYKIPTIRFGMYRFHRSFTGTFKTVLLHYGLRNKNCFWCILLILHYLKHIKICTYLWGALQDTCYKIWCASIYYWYTDTQNISDIVRFIFIFDQKRWNDIFKFVMHFTDCLFRHLFQII